MLTIKKSSKLDGVAYEVRGRVAAQASALEAQGAKILKLNIGNPAPFGFETPEPLLAKMQERAIRNHAESLRRARPSPPTITAKGSKASARNISTPETASAS